MGYKVSSVSIRLKKTKDWNFNYIADNKNYYKLLYLNLEIDKYFKVLLNSKHLNFVKIISNFNNSTFYLYIYYKNYNLKLIKILNNVIVNKNFFFVSFVVKKKELNFIKGKYNKIIKILIFKKLKLVLFKIYLEKSFSQIYLYNFKFFFIPINIKFFNKYTINKSKKVLKLNKTNLKKKINLFFLLYIGVILRESYIVCKVFDFVLNNQKGHKRFFYFIIKDLKKILKFYPYLLGFKVKLQGKLNGKMRAKTIWVKEGQSSINCLYKYISYESLPIITKYGVLGIKIWLIYKNINVKKI